MAMLAVLALAAGAMTVVTVISRNEINHQLDVTNAQFLGRSALDVAGTDPVLATRLALAGYHLDPGNPQIREALVGQLAAMRSVTGVATGFTSRPLTDKAVTKDVRGMLFADEHGVAIVDPGADRPVRHDLVGVPSDYVRSIITRSDEVVVVLADGSVKVWNTAAPDRPRTIAGPGAATRNATVDDNRIGWLTADRHFVTVDRETGAPLGTTTWAVDPGFRDISFTTDPNLLLVRIGRARNEGSRIELRSIADGGLVRGIDGATAAVNGGASTLTCEDPPTGYGQAIAVVREVVTGAEQRRITVPGSCNRPNDLAQFVTADSYHLIVPLAVGATAADSTAAQVISLDTGQAAQFTLPPDTVILTGSTSDTEDLTIGDTVAVLPPGPDGPTEAIGIRGTSVLRLRGVPTPPIPVPGNFLPGPRDGTVIGMTAGATLSVIDVRTGAVVARSTPPAGTDRTDGFLIDAEFAAQTFATGSEWRLERYALPGLTPAGSLAIPRPPGELGVANSSGVTGRIVLSAGGKLAALDGDGRPTGEPLNIVTAPADQSWFRGDPDMTLRPRHPNQVAVLGPRATITLWDLDARQRIADLPRQDVRRPDRIDISADGSLLVARTTDGTLDTWTLDPPAVAGPPIGIDRQDELVGIAADSTIVTYRYESGANVVTWWDRRTGKAALRLGLPGSNRPVLYDDGTALVVAGGSGSLPWRLPLDPQQWADQLCRVAGAPFTPAERDALPAGVTDPSPCG